MIRKNRKISPIVDFIFDLIKLTIIAVLIVWPIHRFIFQPFIVRGVSMEPTFDYNDYLIVEKITYKSRGFQRGDIVVFRSPIKPKEYLIKRVIGLPEERIVIKEGSVYIYNKKYKNGIKLDEEAYLFPTTSTYGKIDIKLKSNEYFLLGDNRSVSLDSRSFGPIRKSEIIGRVWIRGWPFNKITKFAPPEYNL